MKSSSRYVLAFTLALLPPVAWLGSDSVRRDVVEVCPVCESTSRHEEHDWCLWGLGGNSASKPLIQSSPVLRDFPEFHCNHQWTVVSSEVTHRRDGPLFEPPPRDSVVCFWPPLDYPLARIYNERRDFQVELEAALEDGVASRDQLVRWLKFERSMSPEWEWLDLEEDDVEAFEQLDLIIESAGGRSSLHPPHWIETLPPPLAFDCLPEKP